MLKGNNDTGLASAFKIRVLTIISTSVHIFICGWTSYNFNTHLPKEQVKCVLTQFRCPRVNPKVSYDPPPSFGQSVWHRSLSIRDSNDCFFVLRPSWIEVSQTRTRNCHNEAPARSAFYYKGVHFSVCWSGCILHGFFLFLCTWSIYIWFIEMHTKYVMSTNDLRNI